MVRFMKNIKYIIFDMDGTLLDSLTDLQNTLNYCFRKVGFQERTYEEVRSFVGNGLKTLIERAVPAGTSMEKTEEISDSYFGFRTLIPIYAISAMILSESSNYIILWVIFELLTFIGYTIYRRGFHYKKSDVITMCMLLIFLFL